MAMKCAKADSLLNDFVDHSLNQDRYQSLASHLERCERCRRLHDDLIRLKQQSEQMEMVSPTRDLWPGIHRRLSQSRHSRKDVRSALRLTAGWKWVAATTCLVIAAIGLTIMFSEGVRLFNSNSHHLEMSELDHLKQADAHYQLAISTMSQTLPDHFDSLPDELVKVFTDNLAIVDDAIRVCQAAVKAYPDSVDAQHRLVICYRKKIDLLNDIRKLALRAG
jgi:predicted anti-sigma-YlaC factor YlaD